MFLHSKRFGAILSVGLNCLLILLKLVVGIMSGSVAVLASATDSIIDLAASLMAFVAINIAEAPPDKEHPFGHGKFEDFAGLLEAVLIIAGALFISWEAVHRLIAPSPQDVQPVAGIIVMAIALVLDFAVSQYLFRIAKKTESPALEADAHHLSTDVWSTTAVIIGLFLVQITGNPIFDPLMALVVAGLILAIGTRIIRKVFSHLMDTALPAEEEQQIRTVIQSVMPPESSYAIENLKTRRSGSHRLIVFNLRVNPLWTVETAHRYCDLIEEALTRTYPQSIITIHLEPLLNVSMQQ